MTRGMWSVGTFCLVLTLALYPYVYLVARNAFGTLGARALEAGLKIAVAVSAVPPPRGVIGTP